MKKQIEQICASSKHMIKKETNGAPKPLTAAAAGDQHASSSSGFYSSSSDSLSSSASPPDNKKQPVMDLQNSMMCPKNYGFPNRFLSNSTRGSSKPAKTMPEIVEDDAEDLVRSESDEEAATRQRNE